jgi:hypothetical protein
VYKKFSGYFTKIVELKKQDKLELATTKNLKPGMFYYHQNTIKRNIYYKRVFEVNRCINDKQYVQDIFNFMKKGIIFIERKEEVKAEPVKNQGQQTLF